MKSKYGNYSKSFSLRELFNGYDFKKILPQVNYRDYGFTEDGRMIYTTAMKTITGLVYDISKDTARPFYKPLKATKSGNTIILDGVTKSKLSSIRKAVYESLVANKQVLIFTVNNMGCIRSALKESETNKFKYGKDPKLYLRVKSKQEILEMSVRERYALMENIMENIFYADGFEETRKKYKLDKVPVNSPYSYEERKAQWRRRVEYNG